MSQALFAPPNAQKAGLAEPTASRRPFSGLPLFWRLVLVNVVVVFGGSFAATTFTQAFNLGGVSTLSHSAIVLVALLLAAGVTALQLRAALRPVRSRHQVIERFNAGDRSARARVDSGAEPDLAALVLEMNGLWDRLEIDATTIHEKTEHAERLAAQVITAQEDERRRVARELHDEAGQALTAMVIGLERGLAAMPETYAIDLRVQPRKMVADLRDLAAQTLEEIRNLASELRPSVLDDLGLAPALRQYARTTQARTGMETRFTLQGMDEEKDRLPAAVETALFRIAQEAITNAVRHSQARQVQVRLKREPTGIVLEIRDDGVGVPLLPPAPDDGDHLGIFGMRERARLLGGEVSISAVSPRGTLVRAEIPIR